MCIIRKKIQVFSHISAIIQIFWNNRNQYLKSINILYTYTYHRTCFHSIFSLFTNFQKKVKRKSYFTFSRINSDSSTYNDIHNHGHNGAEKGSTIPTVRLTHPPCHPALMYTWFATQVICNTRRFSFRLCYEIPDHLHTPTVGFSSIQIWTMEILGATINVHSERSEFEDRSHGLRVCTHRGPSFSPLKIASLNGHFTVSQVEPGNTIGIDIWMDVYIRGHASFTWEW